MVFKSFAAKGQRGEGRGAGDEPLAIRHSPLAILTFSFFLVVAALFYAPLLLGVRTFPDGDFTQHFLPFSLFQQAEWMAGRLPLWNPYTYSGHPFLADTQAAVFYPLSNLMLLLSLPWQGVGARLYWLQVEVVWHVALAGWFTWLLVRQLTGKSLAGVLAGVSFAFSGYLTGYPPLQLAVLRTAVWLPLILFCLLRAVESRGLRWWVTAGIFLAVAFLAGHPQTFLHILYTVGAWILFLWWVMWRDPEVGLSLKTQLLGFLFFLATTLGLCAAQLLPSLEFTGLSVRASTDYAFVSGGFPIQDTWQLLLPAILTQFSPIYIGIIGLILAASALVSFFTQLPEDSARKGAKDAKKSLSACLAFFACLTVVFLLLSYGGNGFLYPLFYRFAPGWNLFRGQERAAFVVSFGLSVLAGYGVATLDRMTVAQRRQIGLGSLATILIGCIIFWLDWQVQGQSAISNRAFLLNGLVTLLLAGVFTGLTGLTSRTGLTGGTNDWSEWLLVGLVAVNLFWANGTTNLAPFGPVRKTILAPEMEGLQGAYTAQATASLGLPGRVYNEFRLYDDYGMRQGIEDVWGSSPLRLARYARLFENFPLDRMWRLMGVQHILTWRRELFGPSQLLGEYPQVSDSTFLHRLPDANPRAWVAHQWQVSDDEATWAKLTDHQFDLETIGLLAEDAKILTGTVAMGVNEIVMHRSASNTLQISLQSEQGGLLVISENWMPGWQVRKLQQTNSQPIPAQFEGSPLFTPVRADLTLIGMMIPPGEASFELIYAPRSVFVGLWISGGTLLLILIGIYILRGQKL